MELHLTAEQRELLQEVLQEHQRELLREIARADHYHFRQTLRTKEKVLESLLENVSGEASLSPPAR